MNETISSSLTFENVSFRYSAASADVLDLPKLKFANGQFVSVLGSSGSGKSTLLRLVAGLLRPTGGCVTQSVGHVGMVFQSPNLVPWRTARGNVQLPAELGASPSRTSDDVLRDLFALVGLNEADTDKRPAELSGGMQMRVSLARALVLRPPMLLLDEPFAALDDLLRMQLEEDVRRIHNERSLTTVLVTHNIHEAVFMSDRVLVLGGTPSSIQADIDVSLPPERSRGLRDAEEFHHLVSRVTDELHSAAEGVLS